MPSLAAIKKILDEYGQEVVSEIKSNMAATGANASGKTAASLEYFIETKDNGSYSFELYGASSFLYVERGRGKTKNSAAGNPTLKDVIKQWIKDKGIIADDGISEDALAFLISRAIHQRGTLLHLLNEQRDIFSSVITENRIDRLIDRLSSEYEVEISSDIIKTISR